MKVLQVIPYLSSAYGGTGKVVTALAEHLGQLDLEVDLITTNADDLNKLNVPLHHWQNQGSYRIRYFPCLHRNDFIFSPALLAWIVKHLSRYTLVHTHTLFAPLITLLHSICCIYKIPYIVTPHGMLEPWALAYKGKKKFFYFHLLEKPFLNWASAAHALTAFEVQNIKSLQLALPAFTIPNGIDPDPFKTLPQPNLFYRQFPITQNKKIILFLGRIDPKKGLDLLAPAFAQVYARFPQAHLVIAGPDSIGFLPTVKQYFAEAGCLQAVTFTGMLTGTLKFAALAAADLYVAPSYSEGFSMSVLEGMASGLPCVITTGCNFPEAAQAQAATVVPPAIEAIAQALIDSLADPRSAQEMGHRAQRFIFENYTWHQSADKLHQIYENLVN
jgi:glycosyltransferase involved in cell wall biosynthesis